MTDSEVVRFSLRVRLLTGRYVAADVARRERVEWPPHPGRLFMAMTAAAFETDAGPDALTALEWLGGLPAPELRLPRARPRTAVSVFVPVNDAHRVSTSPMPSLPGLSRSRQERTFPTMFVGNEPLDFVYACEPGELEANAPALACVAADVVRIGHSSSLASVSLRTAVDDDLGDRERWLPSETGEVDGTMLRVPVAGTLAHLVRQFGGEARAEFFAAKEAVESTTGKAKTAAKAEFERVAGVAYKKSLSPNPPAPASVPGTVAYRRVFDGPEIPDLAESPFRPELIVLAGLDGPALDVSTTLALTEALRGAVLTAADGPAPAWLSGHEPDGSPAKDPHLAFLPLPFVGSAHADGHLLGLAIALPRSVDLMEFGRRLSHLFVDPDGGESMNIDLTLGRLGVWTLSLEQRPPNRTPKALTSETWTSPSTVWATVTPIVLDRYPKTDRRADREGWTREVVDIVRRSCEHAGLPRPYRVEIGTTSWHMGVPRATYKRRSTGPGRSGKEEAADRARIGDGFPTMRPMAGSGPRPQVHAWIHFGSPVEGPVLVGAGRFFGYGLCRPRMGPGDDKWSREHGDA